MRVREEFRVSERRACELIGVSRSSCRYRPKERGDDGLRTALKGLAPEQPCFGYRRLWVMLGCRGWCVNRKRVYRLYREQGLAARRRKRKRVDEVWTMDFTHDALASGRKFRTLNLKQFHLLYSVSGAKKEALAVADGD